MINIKYYKNRHYNEIVAIVSDKHFFIYNSFLNKWFKPFYNCLCSKKYFVKIGKLETVMRAKLLTKNEIGRYYKEE